MLCQHDLNEDSKEEVLAALKEDIYSTSDVWDWEKVTIYPV